MNPSQVETELLATDGPQGKLPHALESKCETGIRPDTGMRIRIDDCRAEETQELTPGDFDLPPNKRSVLEEAQGIIHGPRRASYGHPKKNFGDIAKMWSVILGVDVTSNQVALCMIGLKVCRHNNGQDRDSVLDIAGYAGCIELLSEKDPT
jgi:hypothetical protein